LALSTDDRSLLRTRSASIAAGAARPRSDSSYGVWPSTTRELPVSETRTFADFDVHPDIVSALSDAGIVNPFPIQAITLPGALWGPDIIGQAKTGPGKTLGFGSPLLQQTAVPGDAAYDALPAPGKPQALVVAPTRELAVQVARDLEVAGKRRGARVLTVYG